MCLFLYPRETLENQVFFYVFKGYRRKWGYEIWGKGYLQFIVLIFINFDKSVFGQEILYVAN